jgi:hypothetical protein
MQVRAAYKNRERISLALTAAAVLLGASALAKVAGFYVQRSRMQGALTLAQSVRDPNGLKQCVGKATQTAEALKQNNLFVKTPPKEHPVKQVEGILGREALIAGKWYKAGDKIADAKIVAIAATNVEIEWDGKKTSLSPMASASAGAPAPPAARGPTPEAGPAPPKPPDVKTVKAEAPAPADDDPLAWMGVKLSPKLRAMLLAKWSSASDEDKEKGKQQWNSMPDEQKQQAIDAMEQRM